MATISSSLPTTGTVTSTGLGSGLDINSLVSQLIAADSQPLTQLNAKEASYQAQLSAYGSVQSALSSFQSAISGLESANAFQTVAATSSDTSVFNATAATGAVPGSYSIEVTQLAQSQKLVSGAFAAVSDTMGTGTLTFQFGTDNGEGGFTPNSDKAVQSVTIDAAHASLSGVRDAINAANGGVSATIINNGTGNRLLLTSQDSGAANSLKVTVSDDDGGSSDGSGLSQLAYDPAAAAGSGKNLTQTVASQDALLNVDGLQNIRKSSNTITDLIQGVTLNLQNVSDPGVPDTLTIANDTSGVQTKMQNFVSAFNDLHSTLSNLTAYDASTQTGGVLQGDSTTQSLERQLSTLLTSNVAGLGGSNNLLSNIGISFQVDGTLTLDSDKLQSVLNSNPQQVANLFATVGTTSDSLISYTQAGTNTRPGSYAVNVTQLATQGSFSGGSTSALANSNGTFNSPLVIDASNDTLVLKVDGVQTGAITLSHGSYATAADLTAELQSKINGSSALSAAGSAVTVGFDNVSSQLKITSNRYGSASNVAIVSTGTGTAATLGLSAGSGTAGVDVAGTINGVTASGSGQLLTGAAGDASAGLQIQISGGALGARGTVNFSKGLATQIDSFVASAIGTNGPISARTDGINKSVTDINNQVTALNQRLSDLQQQYLAKFNAMDALVAQMKTTSDFLTQQLAAITANNSSGN